MTSYARHNDVVVSAFVSAYIPAVMLYRALAQAELQHCLVLHCVSYSCSKIAATNFVLSAIWQWAFSAQIGSHLDKTGCRQGLWLLQNS